MQTIVYDFRQPYEDLANGIVKQAADDYKKALKDLKKAIKEGWDFKAKNTPVQKIHELNRWFRSEWYEMLTKVDSEYLIQHLNMEYGNEETTAIVNETIYLKERI